jgi:glyoxylate reductase
MSILFNRQSQTNDPAFRQIDDLLKEADIISLHTPLTHQTHHLIDARKFSLMKRGAYLINMARGPVVDEQALVKALQTGKLAGAGLDVFENEPEVHPALLDMPNVCLAPHIGGGTQESRHAARQLCIDNVLAVLSGKRPLTPVNEPIISAHHK